jgi:hypothetical protein
MHDEIKKHYSVLENTANSIGLKVIAHIRIT